jgi:putative ABC transport system permease protein
MYDLKFAFRQLLKNSGFTAVAVMVLALGIGANATIFSIINSILIKPLQVRHPEQRKRHPDHMGRATQGPAT